MIKVIQLSDNMYQATLKGRTYVGELSFIKSQFFTEGYSFKNDAEVVPIAGIASAHYENKLSCSSHEWVEVGFRHSKMACKICNRDK